ncbi:MAG TPA: ABC transporter ATP-binding protein, partial [Elusimicrobiota bacterium]|nr:ABC transporter ATP-binding protein [Elusimicrobiota bacterium]
MTALLEIRDLRVEYRRGNVAAVRGVSIDLAPGESLGLAGESGSGKSTLALSVLRLLAPEAVKNVSGRILFKGRDVLALADRELRSLRGGAVATVFQDPFSALNPVLTVGEQIEEVLELHAGGRNPARVRDLLARVRLPEPDRIYASYPHQLSGGQRQRVCLAMAVAGGPELLIADEPTTALDVTVQREIL